MKVESFKELIENSEYGKRPFIDFPGIDVSYNAFFDSVKKIASVPNIYDLPVGSRVLVSLKNDMDLITTAIGLIASGMTVVLVDPETKARRIETIVKTAGVSDWIIDKENAANWDLPKGTLNINLEESSQTSGLVSRLLKKKETDEKFTFRKWLTSLKEVDTMEEIPLTTQALILFTSGSTSAPKGVPLSHKNLLVHLETLAREYEINGTSNILNILPLYHVDGFIQGPLLTLYTGSHLVRPLKFEVNKIEDIFHSIYKYRVSHFFVVPTMLQMLLKFGDNYRDAFDTEEFKFVISSAGVLDATLWLKIVEFFDVSILNVYGLTESVAGGLFHKTEEGKCKAGSIGRPVDVEVRVVDEKGQDVADDEVGELLMKGENIIDSYLIPSNNPDNQGWFHTGDLVYRDADGFFYIKGRKKNVIIRGGVNVYAEEVTEAINIHPDVSESFAIGVKDDIWGEKVVAVVVSQNDLTEDQLLKSLNDVTETKNFPDSVHFVDTLPKGDLGKVQAEEVRKLVHSVNSNSSRDNGSTYADDVKSTILKIASECFTNEVSEDQYSYDSLKIEGWNSLAHLQLATLLEEYFEIKLSVKDIMNITSLSRAEEIVRSKLD